MISIRVKHAKSVKAIQLTFESSLTSDNNGTYERETFKIAEDLYFMCDADDALYWTEFEYDELQNMNEFRKFVRHGR